MVLSYITIMVRDLEKSEKFYREAVGLSVLRRIEPKGGRITFMGGDSGPMIELVDFEGAEKSLVKGLVMSFKADEDIKGLRHRLFEAGYSPSELINIPPKPTHFTVEDPDGITVEFTI